MTDELEEVARRLTAERFSYPTWFKTPDPEPDTDDVKNARLVEAARELFGNHEGEDDS